MRISVPFSYKINAIPFKHKLSSSLSMIENAWVEVPDIESEDLVLALVVTDTDDRPVEHVYTYAGKFWVKDDRGQGDLPFRSQHLPAAGQPIPDASTSPYFARANEERQLSVVTDLLGKVGMLRTMTAGIGEYEARKWLFNGQLGPEFIEVTVESERARGVTSSTRQERLERAIMLAHNNCIAVDGVLYYRVLEPCIVSQSNRGDEILWTFGCPDFFTEKGLSKNRGYPVSVKDYDKIHDWFDTADRSVQVNFSLDVVDESPFTARLDRVALVSNAHRVVADGLYNGHSTPYIAKWCEVRDTLSSLWQGLEGKLSRSAMLERPESDFDLLACALDELGQFGEKSRYGHNLDMQGLKMWDGRDFRLNLAPVRLSP
jgi:hypothetical protein